MAKDWSVAQTNEILFWKGVYGEKDTYVPFKDIDSVHFLLTQLKRFRVDFSEFGALRNLIDVGCGPTGIHEGCALLFSNIEVVASDPLVDTYKELNPRVFPTRKWVNLVGEELELAYSKHFEFVHCSNVIDHVEDPIKVLSNLYNVSVEGGIICVNVHVLRSGFFFLAPILKYIDRNHPHHFTGSKFRKLALEAGMKLTLTYSASIIEDNPDFTLATFLMNPRFRTFKRWMSNLLLNNNYYVISK